jgi:deferrochelatase/peroxidase EfeB
MPDLTRRGLLRAVGAAGVAASAGSVVAEDAGPAVAATRAPESLPFFGTHQQGITTPQQPALCLAAFDLESTRAADLRKLMRRWSAAGARMTQGLRVAPDFQSGGVPPGDSGDVDGMLAGRLTVTFGFGPRIFGFAGLAAHRPAALRPLPRFAGDRLEARRSGGDLVIQACAEDAAIAFHAVRMLATLGAGTVRLRWTQRGFLPSRYRGDQTPRNLMGMKDGTLNPRPSEPGFANVVWVDGSDAAWLRAGTYMVFRRIRMNLPRWDASSLSDQEETIGRHRESGAPLGELHEHDAPNLSARHWSGQLVIPARAHIRLAHPSVNGGVQILRRGYSYDEGVTEVRPLSDGAPHSHAPGFDAGLAFVAFMRDPHAQFVRLQRQLAAKDKLNEYITHVGSAVFAVPPGARPGGYVGETLLG